LTYSSQIAYATARSLLHILYSHLYIAHPYVSQVKPIALRA